MNRIAKITIATLATLSLVVSCQKNDYDLAAEGKITSLTASIEQSTDTRTSLSNDTKVFWSVDDRIRVVNIESKSGSEFTLDGESGQTSGVFRGKLVGSGSTYAYYPSANFISSDWSEANLNSIDFTLPSVQNYFDGGFAEGANPMMAVERDGKLAFSNICGVIRLSLTGTAKVKRILVTSATTSLSGNFSVEPTTYDITTKSEGSKTVTLDCGASGIQLSGDAEYFYIVLPPTNERVTVKIEATDGTSMTKSTDSEISANNITKMRSVRLSADDGTPRIIFKDPKFKRFLLDPENVTNNKIRLSSGTKVDINDNYEISVGEASKIISIKCIYRGIESLEGIEHFINLDTLECRDNKLKSIDISTLTKLRYLSCAENELTSLKIATLTELTELHCSKNNIYNTFDFTKLTKLTKLTCQHNNISTLNISPLKALTYLDFNYNMVSKIDLSGLTKLKHLNCGANDISTIDLSEVRELTNFYCYINEFESIDISGLKKLMYLECSYNEISKLDLTGLTQLKSVMCSSNDMRAIIFTGLTQLSKLGCSYNELNSLDLSKLKDLTVLRCQNNYLYSLKVSDMTKLTELSCYKNFISTLDVSRLTELTILECDENRLAVLDLSELTKLKDLDCKDNRISRLNISKIVDLKKFDCREQKYDTGSIKNLSVSLTSEQYYNRSTMIAKGAWQMNSSIRYSLPY